MKRIAVWMCLLLLPVAGCRKIRDLANINVNIPYSTEVTVPPIYEEGVPIPFGGVNANIGPIGIKTNSKEYLAQYNTNAEKIRAVRLAQFSLKILSPASETIDFLDTVRIYMSAAGQPEFLAAYQFGRANGKDSIALTCSQQELKNYFLADEVFIKLNGRFNRVPAPGTRLGIYTVFNMVANPLY
jgi:hypothetical protein